MGRQRQREHPPADDLRCPWCFAGDTGREWITCPRDQTPMHAECSSEWGACPICRQAVEQPAETSAATRRRIAVRIAPRGAAPTRIEPLPAPLRRFGRQIRRAYDGPLGHPALRHAILLAAIASVAYVAFVVSGPLSVLLAMLESIAAAVAFRERTPQAEALLPRDATPAQRELAERIAARDREALHDARRHRRHRHRARRLGRRLARLREQRQARYAEHLRRTTPIEDAQRIRGVGPAIVGKLRAAGIEHLAALAGSDPRAVSGIGPQRAALLAEWAVERGRAIARLVSSDADFPGRAVLDAVADEHEQPLRQELAQLHTQADTARERLATWRDARPAALVALAAPVEGVS